ncbi:hypothetical protein HR13_10110 [Porphyromonas gulae]|uniref:hypothetical protein n=1 Tax=Porphyromonas gulae TaxID=111105 RepID=UPI00052DFCF3|nr:hypothetical protein [Porphyromonas gulae]KGN77897.1 hypothetical protein HR13_10110 [Porphyromonas gulae]
MRYYLTDKEAATEVGIYQAGDTHRTTATEVLVREAELDGHDAEALSAREVSAEEVTHLLNSKKLK